MPIVRLWRRLRRRLWPRYRRPDMRYVAGDYAEQLSDPLPPLLQELTQEAFALEGALANMISGPVQGAFLQMLVATTGARRVLEIGTHSGFSALMMAAALAPDGELVTCEVDARRAAVAQGYFDRSPHGAKIRLAVEPAAELLAVLQPAFDLIFVVVGAEAAAPIYERCLELLAPKGLLVIDNVLARGAVFDERSERGRATAALNARIAADARVAQVVLTVRDGLMLIRRSDAGDAT